MILEATYVLPYLIFAFAMQIWFFSQPWFIHKYENWQILFGFNLTCDPINETVLKDKLFGVKIINR